jgi:hypothetical protein
VNILSSWVASPLAALRLAFASWGWQAMSLADTDLRLQTPGRALRLIESGDAVAPEEQ